MSARNTVVLTTSAQHGGEVVQSLTGLGLHSGGELPGGGDKAQLTGGVQGIARQLGVAVGPHGGGGVGGGDGLIHKKTSSFL